MGDGAGAAGGSRILTPMEAFAANFRNKQFHQSFEQLPKTEEVQKSTLVQRPLARNRYLITSILRSIDNSRSNLR